MSSPHDIWAWAWHPKKPALHSPIPGLGLGHIDTLWTVKAQQLTCPDVVLLDCAGEPVDSGATFYYVKCHLSMAGLLG